MGDNSKIEWCQASWNPVTGCSKVSPGCDHCYAETFAERWRGIGGHPYEHGFDVTLRPERLGQPSRWRRPRRIFVNSMSDLFHDQVPDDYIADVWAAMMVANQHVYQVLTKRHGRLRSLLCSERFRDMVAARWRRRLGLREIPQHWDWWPAPHIWVGVSVEDQKRADLRVPHLLEVPAKVRFLSCEPLLGPIDLTKHLYPDAYPSGCGCRWPDDADARDCGCTGPCRAEAWRPDPGIQWVIIGGESGPGARPMDIDWATDLVGQCQGAEVAVFCKQLGAHPWRGDQPWRCRDPKGGDPAEWPADLRVRQYPTPVAVEAAELAWGERP